ncbi:TonB-dependent receptor [Flavivirga jejuensis]
MTPKYVGSQHAKTIINEDKANHSKAQQQIVTGTITDQSGFPIPGATVLIKGTTTGTGTNLDGQYSLTVPDPANILVFSSLGFETQEITVGNHLSAGQAGTTINVSLKEGVSSLNEVTINAGYYNTFQRETTGSIYKMNAKTIEKQPVSNPLAAMQGYIPGVNITQYSGVSGSGFNIEIRGKNFIRKDFNPGSTHPLFIVDGVPYASQSLGDIKISGQIVPGGEISPLNLINPASIESIEVLKDADATAIYGSRGANGVVLITTKKGKTGKVRMEVHVSTSLAAVPHSSFADLLNTEQYLEMRLEAIANGGYTLETLPAILKRGANDLYTWNQERYTDWQDVLIGDTAYRKRAQLSFSGGNEQTQFLISGGYQNETTVYIGDSNYRKVSVHNNINHQSVNKRFQINGTMQYASDDNQLPGFSSRFTDLAHRLPPNAPALYDEKGDLNWENNTFGNPLGQLEAKYRSQTSNLIMNWDVSYALMPALVFKANLGYTGYSMDLYKTNPASQYAPSPSRSSKTSSVLTNTVSSQSWIVEPQINWQKDWEKVSINILLGTTFQKQKSNQISHHGLGFPSYSQILDLSAADQTSVLLDEDSVYNYQAVFGRININWDDTYILNLTGRRDGSSRFGPGKQFGNFGAVGVAWLFLKESLFKVLSFGKLRGSYGITGSDTIEDYGFYNSYETSGGSYNGSTLELASLFNPDFFWEANQKFEAALELGFFKDRVLLTTAWYRNQSSNQLVEVPLPGTTGFSFINDNFDATVENTGLEIDFQSVNIQNNHFKWTTTFNISVPKNKLVKFDGLENSTYKDKLALGKPINIVKLFHTIGVNPDTGLYQFEDYNKDDEISSPDRQWIEDTAPKFYGALNNTISYKNWSLEVFFQFKKQRSVNTLSDRLGAPGAGPDNQPVSVLNRWQHVGDDTLIRRYTIGNLDSEINNNYNLYNKSNAIYTDASFIRLRNVSLIYTIPKANIPGMDIRICLQGQNLLTFTKYGSGDPEQTNNSYLPLLRQFTLGMQLGF